LKYLIVIKKKRERTDYPVGMQVAEVNPRPFWEVEIYYVQVANSFDPLEM
jgi:hypothetical protein